MLGLAIRIWFGKPALALIPGLEFIATSATDSAEDNSPLPAGKAEVKEGLVRVPAAIWWLGQLEASVYRA